MSKYMEDKLCRTYCPYYSATGYQVRYKHYCNKYGTYRSWVRTSHTKKGDTCFWMGLYGENEPPDDREPEEQS
jgi:hypothetical protein